MKKLILVDGSYYLFRAYHVPNLQRLKNADGMPTGAIFGVINMLKRHLTGVLPDYFGVVFDAKGKTFRHHLYAAYKANRPAMPDDLRCQIEPLQNIIRKMGIPLLIIDNVEADDVIATLAKQAANNNIKTIISTGDKDLTQLVNDKIHLVNTMNNVSLDKQAVEEKFGVPPELIVDYLTLVGDSIDNVPGVPKVGPKTAVHWLLKYGSLDRIIACADEIKGKIGENLRQSLAQIPLSRKLVTLKDDVRLKIVPEEMIIQSADNDALKTYYTRFNFQTWLTQIDAPNSGQDKTVSSAKTIEQNYETITSIDQLASWIDKLNTASLISIDTETTSLDYMDARIVGVSIAVEKNHAAYIPLQHDYVGAPRQLAFAQTMAALKPILENEEKAKIGQNLKYDMAVFANHGIHLRGIQHDTMLESYVVDSTASRHDMDSLAKYYLSVSTIRYEDVAGKGAKQIPFNQVSIENATPYAAEDADIVLQLHNTLAPRLEKCPAIKKVYDTIEIPLVPVLAKMERHGVMLDAVMLSQQGQTLRKKAQEIEMRAHELAGQPFNISSPKQIQAILYEKMNLPVLVKTPTGQPSTAESVLQDLADNYELPRLILDYRHMDKLRSTYTEKLPRMINKTTGRLHTSYHQAVTATGRLSSSDPNLQNIPIRTEAGRQIRQAFIAPVDYILVAADYSQIELRIMAHLSQDRQLLKAFASGMDIHKTTAADIFNISVDKVDKQQRRAAKAINFGLIYGMSAFGLAKQLGINRNEAEDYINVYFERYPSVKHYMDNTRQVAKDRGYVETLYGRRLYLPDINAKNASRRQYAERTAINAPMQGTAADMIKLAMIDIHHWFEKEKIDAAMIMQVHDELVFEVNKNRSGTIIAGIRQRMSVNTALDVPLEINIGIGHNWDEAH